MPWVISFIISWILFCLLVDKSTLKMNKYGGFLALAMGTLVDYGGNQMGLYEFYDIIVSWAGCSAFYKFGPIFTMGIIFCQYVPTGKWLQVANIFAASGLYIMLEISIISSGVARYIHWTTVASFVINLLAFSSLTWFTTAFLRGSQ